VPFWRIFGKAPSPVHAAWWQDADHAAEALTQDAITRLRAGLTAPEESAADDDERRQEMIEGLERLQSIALMDNLPAIETGHRVIGDDICHQVAPVTLADSPVAGKLFLTSTRVVFASAGVKAWPWHRVREVSRSDRDLVVTIGGSGDALHVRCNTYADALIAAHIARRLVTK
jgi:hypothetical protein